MPGKFPDMLTLLDREESKVRIGILLKFLYF
jgi:hypothetical protein